MRSLKIHKAGLFAATLTALAFAMPRVASACAMCGLSPGDKAGHAFNTSVIAMLVGPYITVSIIGGIIYLAYRRAQRDKIAPIGSAKDHL